jgi:hypothetical protein
MDHPAVFVVETGDKTLTLEIDPDRTGVGLHAW